MEPADPAEPGPFAWAQEGVIAEHLEAAGFVEHDVERVEFAERFASVEDWWAVGTRMSSRVGAAVAAMDAATRSAVVAELAERAEPFKAGDGSLAIPAKTWVGAATG